MDNHKPTGTFGCALSLLVAFGAVPKRIFSIGKQCEELTNISCNSYRKVVENLA